MMNVMFVLFATRAFSDVIEGANSKKLFRELKMSRHFKFHFIFISMFSITIYYACGRDNEEV